MPPLANTKIDKQRFQIARQIVVIAVLQFTFGLFVIPDGNAQLNFDDDAYGTLIRDADKRIKEMKKIRKQREEDLVREDALAKEEQLLREKRPVFGSRKVGDSDEDNGNDKLDEDQNKIFSASVKKREKDRRMKVTLTLDVDDDDNLDSMKSDKDKKADEEKEEAEKERDEEDRKLAKRREERKAAFDDLTDKPYFEAHWVPSDYDPLSNGGFGTDDGNGRPVPYHLNGHPDLQRSMPWDDD